MSKKELYFKCENFQKTGSFKARGALNAIKTSLEKGEVPARIVTHSSGNHGQAVAWASRQLGLPCTVVVPQGTPTVKCEAIKEYGAELVFCTPSPTGRKEAADRIASETNGLIIHPYDDYNVIAGQGTIGLELLDEVPDLDIILVPISGGGMTSGIAIAAHHINPKCQVIAVEPVGKNLQESLQAQERKWENPPQFLNTIAEGIKTQQVGHLTFPILCNLVKQVVTVTDQEMADGCKILAERMKLVVEAASGAAVAAALSKQVEYMPGLKIGVILCGGNLDMDSLPWQNI
ncbi:serine racemase [Eurytemora carolleeae]|uniref:serine racemase n=1 Tax=Eurytemora carolleeae TaxID=1294199 RepID=UPI000C772D24|nr:serine racemase [Eurytemora carolleeae]|eukprot:XP_023320430.1 serine racemase-like [Eurytemora affinis]